MDHAIDFDNVWKKFRRGGASRSLRDAIPALCKQLLKKPTKDELKKNEFYSLKDVNFQVPKGQCLGVIGPNGAGKSTLLKCASRILRPNKGSVNVKGRVSALIEVGAGFHPDLTGRENIFLNASILGMKRADVKDRFDEIVDFSGMADFIDTPVKRYSSGMYARLGFSVAAFMEPDVLLIDEVLSVGDASFSQKCFQKIRSILQTNTTVMFVSHNLAAVQAICDRVLVLAGGTIRFDGTPNDALHAYHSIVSNQQNTGQSHPSLEKAGIEYTDKLGDTPGDTHPGDTRQLSISITPKCSIDKANLGLFIIDERDTLVYETNLAQLGISLPDLKAGQHFQADFRLDMNLLPGSYWIGTFVEGFPENDRQSQPVTLDRTCNRLNLVIAGTKPGRGVANLFASAQAQQINSPIVTQTCALS